MKQKMIRAVRLLTVIGACLSLSACEEPRVYGSIGVSSYGGGGYYGGGPRMGGSISVGGRIY